MVGGVSSGYFWTADPWLLKDFNQCSSSGFVLVHLFPAGMWGGDWGSDGNRLEYQVQLEVQVLSSAYASAV